MYFSKKIDDIYKDFNSERQGLSTKKVIENREKFGENKLKEKKKASSLSIFLSQFKDLLVIILIIAAIISSVTGNMESTIIILLVIILNAILGTIQTLKAEKSLESLKSLSSPTAKVIREGTRMQVKASELVAGDIIKVDAGDIVPADARLIEAYSLKVNESALTGESESVDKDHKIILKEKVALGDQLNMIFSGSLVTYGRGVALVTGVGKTTELGKISELLASTSERKTPLQTAMDNFSKKLSIIIMIICVLVFLLSLYRGTNILDALLFAVALAVAAIPEALSSIITISLAIGTSRMARENAIVKQLKAVEGLGCVSVICSDKTGTLTQNKMTVEDSYFEYGEENILLSAAALCNDTAVVEGQTFGDPTETALVDYYRVNKIGYEELLMKNPRIAELPFDSDRKLMSTLHHIEGKTVMFTKGAPDVILSRCKYTFFRGKKISLDEEARGIILDQNTEFSRRGLRVLAFGYKNTMDNSGIDLSFENDLIFLGLIAMMDPPRIESAQAVADCMAAGIKPVMITGDHRITASAIAKKIGILRNGDMAVTGPELDSMSHDDLMNKLEHISVYARVSPDNKIRIVKAWQELGNVVSMTGDGVNDAPALKQADIGIAMGITGTQVSKDAASMILTDDNFATIIKSVLNGRNIYANIKNAIEFLLSGNAAGIIAVLFASLMDLPAPFAAVHLLFINLITDSLPALAISMEPSNPLLIKEKPRSNKDSLLSKEFISKVSFNGILIGTSTLIAFYSGLAKSTPTAMTMAFATLCLARLWHGFNARGSSSIFKLGITTNLYTIGAFFLGGLLLCCVLFMPILQRAFLVTDIEFIDFIRISLLAFAPTVIIQIKKVVFP